MKQGKTQLQKKSYEPFHNTKPTQTIIATNPHSYFYFGLFIPRNQRGMVIATMMSLHDFY